MREQEVVNLDDLLIGVFVQEFRQDCDELPSSEFLSLSDQFREGLHDFDGRLHEKP